MSTTTRRTSPATSGKLMGRYDTRQDEVDQLFRGDVLVDLYQVVRQGIRASVESYSIKKLEPFYGFEREIELRDAGSSIVEFEHWLELGGTAGVGEEILDKIEDYNRDDVVSTLELLAGWRTQRAELAAQRGAESCRARRSRTASQRRSSPSGCSASRTVAEPLTAGIPEDETERDLDGRRARAAAAGQPAGLASARAEARLVALLQPAGDDRGRDDRGAGAARRGWSSSARGGRRQADVSLPLPGAGLRGRAGHRSTPPTEGHAGRGDSTRTATRSCCASRAKRTSSTRGPGAQDDHRDQGRRSSGCWTSARTSWSTGSTATATIGRRATCCCRRTPDIEGHLDGEPLRPRWRHGRRMRHGAGDGARPHLLAIQGPPGSGKTYIGGRMILDLVAQGKTVGVTANSHKVIGKLLDDVWAAQDDYPAFAEREVRHRPEARRPKRAHVRDTRNPSGRAEDVAAALHDGSVDVVGGTAWLWTSAKIPPGLVDVLFIDEAGQFSLANSVAVSAVAKSIVLLGDPQQLDQPLKGSHPPGAERSALAHLLGRETRSCRRAGPLHGQDLAAAPGHLRLHLGGLLPERAAAGGRQRAAGALRRRASADGEGIRFVAVDHAEARNDNASIEEARVIADIVGDLLEGRATWLRPRGRWRFDHALGHPRHHALQRPADAHQGGAAQARRGLRRACPSAPWTSSRASRRRSRSTRWPLAAGGCATRHGVPLLAQPAQRGHLARPLPDAGGGIARRSSLPVPGRPARWCWPTRSAACMKWPARSPSGHDRRHRHRGAHASG